MQWGSPTCRLFSARYPPSSNPNKRCKHKQAYRPQALVPRIACQSPAAPPVSHGGDTPSTFEPSSPPRRGRLKPPLRWRLTTFLTLFLVLISSTVTTAGNKIKLRILPSTRFSSPLQSEARFLCTGGQPPYRWEYQIQEDMTNWRFKIRLDKDNCKRNNTVRLISESSSDRVWANSTTGELFFSGTEFNDTGIYRCWSLETGCIELHLLVFEPISYTNHIRIIYGLLALILFVASLSTAWQLWQSSAFHRRAMARSRGESSPKGASGNNGNGISPTFAPVIRLFQRNRRPPDNSSSKPGASSTNHNDESAHWPVLRRRLSSIEDTPTMVVPLPIVVSGEEQIRVSFEVQSPPTS